jgi:HD-GYP domain-containing protein (c-di-GMP phosphodiesterase class II)
VRDIALSEVVGSLSYALDITEGQPPGHALRSCMIGMRLAEAIDLPAPDRSNLFYALLLKDAGCSANAERMAALFGADDQEAKRTSKLVDWSSPFESFKWALRTVAPGERIARLRAIRDEGDVTRGFMAARCERGAEIARMLYLTDSTAEAIRALDEHWDGRGAPAGLQGEEIPLLARILCLAQTAEVFHARGGVRAVRRVVRKRRGRWFDPGLVDALLGFCGDDAFWRALATPDVSAWEPGDRRLLADAARLDRITEAFARVIDAKSPYTARHSERVAEIAVGLGRLHGVDRAGLRDLRRAALLHDIGKLAISNRILDKPGRLDEDELALMKAHPLYSLRILERAECFAALAPVAAAHHEKLDGSGYPFGLTGDALDLPMRILAVADIYEALTALRPYRGPMAPADALAVIARDVPHKLDARVVAALEDLVGAAPQRAAA